MTNEEAIKELSEWLDACCGGEEIEPTKEAFRMAIEALKAHADLQQSCNELATDTISRQAAIDAPVKMVSEGIEWIPVYHLKDLPSAQPDNRLSKIADLVEGTIDHFNLDDAMDLLYQIKEVLK